MTICMLKLMKNFGNFYKLKLTLGKNNCLLFMYLNIINHDHGYNKKETGK